MRSGAGLPTPRSIRPLVAENALGPTLTPTTLRAIKQAESPAQGMALFLTAPEFQRR